MVDVSKSNPLKILRALDNFLKSPFQLIVYGRSALTLGYPNPGPEYCATMDVDAILPSKDLQAIEANDDFWKAQDEVNEMFAEAGLYFTHLFEEKQVILSPHWLSKLVRLDAYGFERLRLYRPSTEDLILTKMMRVDPQDRGDIRFLMRQDGFSWTKLESYLEDAVCPAVSEIQNAFAQNTEWIRKLDSA